MNEAASPLRIHGITDVGVVRDNNEDAIAYDEPRGFAILADGMGGHNAGEVASQLTVKTVEAMLNDAMRGGESPDDVPDLINTAVQQANMAVYERSKLIADCKGMGTTVVVACVEDETLHIANVGDSRLYLYRENTLHQVTRDHSLVADMVEKGFLSPEEAQNSNQKNIITRAIGLQAEIEVDLYQQPMNQGDMFLLCSDGLSDVVNDAQIQASLEAEELDDLEALSQQLVKQALQAGGPDNISVILMQAPA
ncbi:MAG: Stp1/IreP family PP2C-type Ser/Thr phosphatase [Gammaproteobacteria bacterium]|nr:Stp1/IreP family PP2C-type Ser/Thr phosphatase [Gammaproteobacteria bacterium]